MTGAESRQPGWLTGLLVCPRDRSAVTEREGALVCAHGHAYAVVNGIPVMLRDDVSATQEHIVARSRLYAESAARPAPHPDEGIHPFVQEALGATCGNLYLGRRPDRYPIPQLRLGPGAGRVLLDIGCNWGRWTVSAGQAGFRALGADPNLEALLVAQMVAARLGVAAHFVACDARYLPFKAEGIDCCFSYSVLQHFAPEDARAAVGEIGRVLKPGGEALVQMANRLGARNLAVQARRGFRPAREFEVRYWSTAELLALFEREVGPSQLEVDGFFGLGVQPGDAPHLSAAGRAQVRVSELLRPLARRARWLGRLADSVYVRATAS